MKKLLFTILIIGMVSCNDEACTPIKLDHCAHEEAALLEAQLVSDSVFLQNQGIIDSLNTTDELLDYLSSMPVD
jgi:hypothetical protein